MADASRYQLAARAIDRHTRAGPAALRAPQDRHRLPARPRRRAQRAPRRRRGGARVPRPAAARASRPPWPPRGPRPTWRRCWRRCDEREEVLDLVEGYRRLKARLGLMDFSDQIALAAELAAHAARGRRARAGEVQGRPARRVPGHLGRAGPAARLAVLRARRRLRARPPGHGRRRPQPGDLRLARGVGLQHPQLRRRLPAGRRAADVPTYSLTVNRRSDRRILEVANALAAPAVRRLRPGRAARGQARRGAGRGAHRRAPDLRRRARLAGRAGPRAPPGDGATPSRPGARSACSPATTATPQPSSTRSPRREIPVEIVGLKGLLRLPEVAEVVATLALLHDLTANADLLTLLTGPRWAIGPRDLALLGRRAARADRRPAARGRPGRRRGAAARRRRAPTRPRCSRSTTRWTTPASAPTRPRRASASRCWPSELRRLRAHVGEPLLDLVRRIIDTTGLDVELASSVTPAAAARRDNLDLFVKAVADFQAIDGAGHPGRRCWPGWRPRTSMGSRPRPGHAVRGRLGQAAHRPPRQGPGVGRRCSWSGCAPRSSRSPRARSQWTTVSRVLPAPLRGDAADVPQLRGHDRAAIDRAQGGRPGAPGDGGAAARATSRSPAPGTSCGCRRTSGARRGRSRCCPRRTSCAVQGGDGHLGRRARAVARPPGGGHPQPAPGRPAVDRLAGDRPAPPSTSAGSVAAELVRAEMADPSARRGAARPGRDLAGGGVGRRARPAARRGPGRARRPCRRTAAEQPVGHRRRPAARRPRAVRPRPGPADAATAVAGRPLRHPLPRLGRGALRPAVAARPRRPARARRPRHRRRGRPARADRALRGRARSPTGCRWRSSRRSRWSSAGRWCAAASTRCTTSPDGGFLLVDWKTNREQTADPLQLALYRLAWAELTGTPLEQVRAAFHYVRSGRDRRAARPRGPRGLTRLLVG